METTTNAAAITTDATIAYRGTSLRRRTETGPRGGLSYIYQHVDASPVWGYWFDSAAQAARDSDASDRVRQA